MVDTTLIKKLRENTGCGMADCNKALRECGDNYEDAVDWLRKKGLSSAAKKSSRATTEGLVGLIIEGNKASMVEVNSGTDFVARNDQFQNLVSSIAKAGLQVKNNENFVEEVAGITVSSKKVSEELTDKIAIIGENLQVRRGYTMSLKEEGIIISYIHSQIVEGLGKIGVLIALKSTASKDSLNELGRNLAMHIAATKPECLNQSEVTAERIQREKDIFVEQARSSGKPDNIIEKMIEGRMRKFYEEICLLDQGFVMDDKMKVSEVLIAFGKENKATVEIIEYKLFVLGEGLEKKENDFASEVASMTK